MTEETSKKKKFIIWLKTRAYVDKDGDTRWDAGIYSATKVPFRLQDRPDSVVEIFNGDIPPRKLALMAKWCGVMHPEDSSDDELLEKMVSEPRPV